MPRRARTLVPTQRQLRPKLTKANRGPVDSRPYYLNSSPEGGGEPQYTLHRFHCDDMPDVQIFFCDRCTNVIAGDLRYGIYTRCPQCSCTWPTCHEPREYPLGHCTKHSAEFAEIMTRKRKSQLTSWVARARSRRPERLKSVTDQLIFDPALNLFYDSFRDWVLDVDPEWLLSLKPKQYLLMHTTEKQVLNPFAKENMLSMAEEEWEDLNEIEDHPEIVELLTRLEELTDEIRPIYRYASVVRRVDPAIEIRDARWAEDLRDCLTVDSGAPDRKNPGLDPSFDDPLAVRLDPDEEREDFSESAGDTGQGGAAQGTGALEGDDGASSDQG